MCVVSLVLLLILLCESVFEFVQNVFVGHVEACVCASCEQRVAVLPHFGCVELELYIDSNAVISLYPV